jgi:hypothetical protein
MRDKASPLSDIYHECAECKAFGSANSASSSQQAALRLKVRGGEGPGVLRGRVDIQSSASTLSHEQAFAFMSRCFFRFEMYASGRGNRGAHLWS